MTWRWASGGGKLHAVATEQVVGTCQEKPYDEFRSIRGMEAILRVLCLLVLLASPFIAAALTGPGGFRWIGIGALSWVVAIALKLPLAAGAGRLLRNTTRGVRAGVLLSLA